MICAADCAFDPYEGSGIDPYAALDAMTGQRPRG